MSFFARAHVLAFTAALGAAPCVHAATPKEIEAAVQKGAAYLQKSAGDNPAERDPDRVGATALVGLALLETGTPADDPVVRKVTARIRDATYTQTQTYQITLCILYLDRHGDPADHPLIQMLAVRLLAGQNTGGGWTYGCIAPVPPATERFLRTKLSDATLVAGGKEPGAPKPVAPMKQTVSNTGKPVAAGKLHADVEKYRQGLLATDTVRRAPFDDNSNTQFGILGVWTARKHGVPVEHALDLIEKRFLGTQGASGGWPYRGPVAGPDGSPSMTCAGLIGLATAVGRREERALKADVAKPPAKPAPKAEGPVDPTDPFTNPPPPPPSEPAKKAGAPVAPKSHKPDARDTAIKRGMEHLAGALSEQAGRGRRGNTNELYFLWSLERVGVIYGVDKIGATDWFEYASDLLVGTQNPDGSWGAGRGGYGPDIDTSFALLVLGRSNLARDLSARVQKDLSNTELRAGSGGGAVATKPPTTPDSVLAPMPVEPSTKPAPATVAAKPVVPAKPGGGTPGEVAAELFRATGANWPAALQKVRDAKGTENTSALLAVIPLLDGDRKTAARDALAERLCRMSATTLRGMLKAEDAELRRAAALACAMKDDKEHVPDLIAVVGDKDETVAKAARAGLKSLTGKDFASAGEWQAWLAKDK